jgi:hypothetical protein
MINTRWFAVLLFAGCGCEPGIRVDPGPYRDSDVRLVLHEAFTLSGTTAAEERAAGAECRVLVVPVDAPRAETCGAWAGCVEAGCVIRVRATDPCAALTALGHEALHVAQAEDGRAPTHEPPLFATTASDARTSAVYRAMAAATAATCSERLGDIEHLFDIWLADGPPKR